MRPRRVVPMRRRLPSGLIPPQFRNDDAETTKKPPTPYELAQKLARAQQQPTPPSNGRPADNSVSKQSPESTDNVPKDSTPESDHDTEQQIPKPSAALFQKRRKPRT